MKTEDADTVREALVRIAGNAALATAAVPFLYFGDESQQRRAVALIGSHLVDIEAGLEDGLEVAKKNA